MVNSVDLDEVCQNFWERGERTNCAGWAASGTGSKKLFTWWQTTIGKRWVRGELFLSRRRTPISRKMIWVLVKDYARRAGIEKNLTPPVRHSFATHLLMGGQMYGQYRKCWVMQMWEPRRFTLMWSHKDYRMSTQIFILLLKMGNKIIQSFIRCLFSFLKSC